MYAFRDTFMQDNGINICNVFAVHGCLASGDAALSTLLGAYGTLSKAVE